MKVLLLLLVVSAGVSGSSVDLTVESIKDSASLLEKISRSDDPLYSLLSKAGIPKTRSEIVEKINMVIIKNTNFAYEVTKLEELMTNTRFEDLASEKQSEVMARNLDLLTELYPDEIAPRNKDIVKQGIGIKTTLINADTAEWIKADIVHFLNVIITNKNVLNNSTILRDYFDAAVGNEEIQMFANNLKNLKRKKIPINQIKINYVKVNKSVAVEIKVITPAIKQCYAA